MTTPRSQHWLGLTVSALVSSAAAVGAADAGPAAGHAFNGPYRGPNLARVAFPIGGMGAGMFCLEGSGAISHLSVRHQLEFFNEPACFAALCVLEEPGAPRLARVVEGPIPDWKYFGAGGTGNGGGGRTYGLPRFREAEFLARFPFATVNLRDAAVPFAVEITGWSPFTPPDPDPAILPVGMLEYRFRNTSDQTRRAVFSFNTRNFMGDGAIGPVAGGFVLYAKAGEGRDRSGAFALFVDGETVTVDHCWFRGGWWDPLTIAWHNVEAGLAVSNPPVPGNAPGASLAVPFTLAPGAEKTIRLQACWYVPESGISFGAQRGGVAFRKAPSRGTATGQQPVSGFLGRGLVNTFDPSGDGPTGTLTSPEIRLDKRYLHFLVGGGAQPGQTCVNLLVDGQPLHSACGRNTEVLEWTTFDLAVVQGKAGRIQIVDQSSGGWGHTLADHFVLSDEPLTALRTGRGNEIANDPARVALLADFEGDDYGGWTAESAPTPCDCGPGVTCDNSAVPATYSPWYATRFASLDEVITYWRAQSAALRQQSAQFRDAFYDTTLPPEAVEAVAANLTILKSPTVLRQHDGRLWCWEGCGDGSGCCGGSCAHVWNYAQAVSHLFPALARGMRETGLREGLDKNGRQAFRVNLPISCGGGAFDAADGQLGEIMNTYREWRIAGDKDWLKRWWPRLKMSLDHAIATWDPRHTGLLEEDHHNTYDINYFGPDGHCGSFYLGALAAAIRMGTAADAEVVLYRELLDKGRRRLEEELFNGEWFIQKVLTEDLTRSAPKLNPAEQSDYYRAVAEEINRQGPRYQYGTGCLSDGVLGLWIARACGLDEDIVAPAKVSSHLMSVYRHNLKHDLTGHANPQRPTYAMGTDGGLLLCTWPRGDKPLLPFVYSDEVWTGIEYQVASHLILTGHPAAGLDIVRTCRSRHDGVRRNPFNEYECGHWYARSLSSYGLLQALGGARYDAVDKVLYLRPALTGDYRVFLSTASGYGTAGIKAGKPFLEVRSGTIPAVRIDVTPQG
jgi:uncharacterized protein (DUF608 family)